MFWYLGGTVGARVRIPKSPHTLKGVTLHQGMQGEPA